MTAAPNSTAFNSAPEEVVPEAKAIPVVPFERNEPKLQPKVQAEQKTRVKTTATPKAAAEPSKKSQPKVQNKPQPKSRRATEQPSPQAQPAPAAAVPASAAGSGTPNEICLLAKRLEAVEKVLGEGGKESDGNGAALEQLNGRMSRIEEQLSSLSRLELQLEGLTNAVSQVTMGGQLFNNLNSLPFAVDDEDTSSSGAKDEERDSPGASTSSLSLSARKLVMKHNQELEKHKKEPEPAQEDNRQEAEEAIQRLLKSPRGNGQTAGQLEGLSGLLVRQAASARLHGIRENDLDLDTAVDLDKIPVEHFAISWPTSKFELKNILKSAVSVGQKGAEVKGAESMGRRSFSGGKRPELNDIPQPKKTSSPPADHTGGPTKKKKKKKKKIEPTK